MVNDLYFLHERAGKMSWYVNSISAGNTLGVSSGICMEVIEADFSVISL